MYLSCALLAYKASCLLICIACQRETQASDVRVRRGAIVAALVFDLAYLHHFVREGFVDWRG